MADVDGDSLRTKYLDWCSARLAEHYLSLSPEEAYELARPGSTAEPAGAVEETSGGLVSHRSAARAEAGARGESYWVEVQRMTDALLDRIRLPSFEVWRREYEAEPDRFESDLLGFRAP